MRLGINIDHIAYLRETRKINDPDPLEAVFLAKRAGADQITIHLREDRRHIHDSDLVRIAQSNFLPLNVECSNAKDIVALVCETKPHRVTLVPEKREEVTTEGGLALGMHLLKTLEKFCKNDISIAIFIDANKESIEKTLELREKLGTSIDIELHTGRYANLSLMLYSNLSRTQHAIDEFNLPRSQLAKILQNELENLTNYAKLAKYHGINVYAGHGLNYHNVQAIAKIKEIEELNIGQSIIARSIFVGLEQAIKDMKQILQTC